MRSAGRLAGPQMSAQAGELGLLVAFVSITDVQASAPAMAMTIEQYSQRGGRDHHCTLYLHGGRSLAQVSWPQPATQKVRCVHGFSGGQAKLICR